MGIQKEVAVKNAVCNLIVDRLDLGTDYSMGHLSIYDSDMTKITWHELSNPAFGDATDGTSTAYSIADATAQIDGTANNFAFENRDGTNQWTGDVTLVGGGGALQLESISIASDTTVGISSAKYIVPA